MTNGLGNTNPATIRRPDLNRQCPMTEANRTTATKRYERHKDKRYIPMRRPGLVISTERQHDSLERARDASNLLQTRRQCQCHRRARVRRSSVRGLKRRLEGLRPSGPACFGPEGLRPAGLENRSPSTREATGMMRIAILRPLRFHRHLHRPKRNSRRRTAARTARPHGSPGCTRPSMPRYFRLPTTMRIPRTAARIMTTDKFRLLRRPVRRMLRVVRGVSEQMP